MAEGTKKEGPKTINELFKGKAFMPFDRDIGSAAAGSGPQPVVGYTLAQLADEIKLPEHAGVSAPQARPNPLANMTSFVSDVNAVNRMLSDNNANRTGILNTLKQEKPDVYARYIEWSALSAVVALRGVYSMYGLRVDMYAEELNANVNLFDRALLFALNNMSLSYRFQVTGQDPLTASPITGKLFYLTQDGKPFALYSDEISVCPMVDYHDVSFEGLVSWYKPGENEHKSWLDPLNCNIGDYAENRFKWWMVHNNRQVAVGVKDPFALQSYDRCATPGDWQVPNAALTALYNQSYAENVQRAANFCTVCGAYLDNNEEPQMLPRFFTSELLLAQKTSEDEPCGLGYNTTDGNWNALELIGDDATRAQLSEMNCMVPVIPFTREAVELYGSEFTIQSLSFKAHAAGVDELKSVDMHAVLQLNDIQPQTFIFTRTYPIEKIVSGLLPYLMVWPWVPLPINSWNLFYATQKESDASFNQLCGEGFSGALTLELPEGNTYSVQEKGNPQATQEAWQVTSSNFRFRYALVYDKEEHRPMGVVLIPKVEDLKAAPIPADYEVSVDFGTTSTVCAIKNTMGDVDFLPYTEFGRNVTTGDHDGDIVKVAERRWLGRASAQTEDTLLARKTLSAAQLFDCVKPDDEPTQMFVDGRFFLATSTQLCGYTANGGFAHQGIYNDLKLSTENDVDQSNASVLFLAGVYTQALLYVLSTTNGAGRISALRVSYPGALTRNILGARWYQAADLINSCLYDGNASPYALDPTAIQYCTEAEAAQHYNNRTTVDMAKYLNVDIGGGTTDLSVVLPDAEYMLPTLSFKYAGREIIINSFIQAYRRWKEDGDFKQAQKHFKKIWTRALDPQMTEERADLVRNQLVENFFARCAQMDDAMLAGAHENETLRTLLEILLNDFDMVLPNQGEYNLLREIFSLKFFLLMFMVAEFMAQNPTMMADLTDIVISDEGEEVDNLCISLTGTAAMTLQHVFNQPLNQLQQLSSLDSVKPAQRMMSKVAAMMARVMGKKNLSVTLRLSTDVREKKEVAFGVLFGATGVDQQADISVKEEEVVDLVFCMEPEQRRMWYKTTFGAPMIADEEKQRAQVEKKVKGVDPVDLEKYKNDLSQKVNASRLICQIAQLQKDNDELVERVEQFLQEWSAFVNVQMGTWPAPAPVGANVGMGKSATRLNQVLPKGIALKNSINEALRNIRNANEMRYLSSVSEDSYREALLMVYVVERVINQTLYRNQM